MTDTARIDSGLDGAIAPHPYEKPVVVDYGSLTALTATNGVVDTEDGVGKVINSDGSGGFVP